MIQWGPGDDALPMHLKTISIALAVIVISFVVSLKVMDFVAPRGTCARPRLSNCRRCRRRRARPP